MTYTREAYEAAFEVARRREHPEIDALEKRLGFAVDLARLEAAAQILACPVKVNEASWQHGRVVYAAASVVAKRNPFGVFLDIGTAKSFTACVIGWALAPWLPNFEVISIDVVDPLDRVPRNSVAELDGFLTVEEFAAPFIERSGRTSFLSCGSQKWLSHAMRQNVHVPFAFIDGKHTYQMVREEIIALRKLQELDDVIVFDDLQIPGVAEAVDEITGYKVVKISAGFRVYAVATRSST